MHYIAIALSRWPATAGNDNGVSQTVLAHTALPARLVLAAGMTKITSPRPGSASWWRAHVTMPVPSECVNILGLHGLFGCVTAVGSTSWYCVLGILPVLSECDKQVDCIWGVGLLIREHLAMWSAMLPCQLTAFPVPVLPALNPALAALTLRVAAT